MSPKINQGIATSSNSFLYIQGEYQENWTGTWLFFRGFSQFLKQNLLNIHSSRAIMNAIIKVAE